jgi:hypothetical protein
MAFGRFQRLHKVATTETFRSGIWEKLRSRCNSVASGILLY